MMHGYLALDAEGRPLAPFRTWRNNITGRACEALSGPLEFAVPQRWSIAHLYQSILEAQEHVPRIAHLFTLAGYVHWKLTGEKRIGVGEASGMFPVEPGGAGWDGPRASRFDALVAPLGLPWRLRDLLPGVLPAGAPAGALTPAGARLLDPSGHLEAGVPLCPPEGDAGTGMVATNCLRPRTGNVSAGTSVFAMVVLERSLARRHGEIDIVATPDGNAVAMAHANNCSADLDAWMALFGQVGRALGAEARLEEVYARILPLALRGAPDAGGLLAINYVSGEHVTGFSEGRPLLARSPESAFTLENLVRAMVFASLCALRTGMDVLTGEEGVAIDELRGHGGFFKGGDTGQRLMAAALEVPVSLPATAGEGGAWGMALLAAYRARADRAQRLPDFLDARLAAGMGKPVPPDPRDVEGFRAFYARHRRGLAVEAEAVKALR
jgi:sugar (pentulose or hexulose) kinase